MFSAYERDLFDQLRYLSYSYIENGKSVGDCICTIPIPKHIPAEIRIDVASHLSLKGYDVTLDQDKITVSWIGSLKINGYEEEVKKYYS